MSRPDRPCEAGAAVATDMRASSIPETPVSLRARNNSRPFHVSVANHIIDLQRRGFETADLLVIGGSRLPNVILCRSTAPGDYVGGIPRRAACNGGIQKEPRYTAPLIQVLKCLCELGKLIGEVNQIIRPHSV